MLESVRYRLRLVQASSLNIFIFHCGIYNLICDSRRSKKIKHNDKKYVLVNGFQERGIKIFESKN